MVLREAEMGAQGRSLRAPPSNACRHFGRENFRLGGLITLVSDTHWSYPSSHRM